MNIRRLAILYAVMVQVVQLAACGGGGSSSPAPTTPTPLPPPDPAFGGIWVGTMTFDSGPVTEEAVGLVSEDGQFRFLSVSTPVQFAGIQSVDAGVVTGGGNGFTDLVFLDGSKVTEFTMTGTLVAEDSFDGSWSTTAGDAGTFEFFYDVEYERDSSLALLEGQWTSFDEDSNPVATFDIDATGQLNGQNSNGCTSLGQFLILDGRYNVYQLDSEISGCGIAGVYSGLVVLGDLNSANDALVVAIDDGVRALLLGIQK